MDKRVIFLLTLVINRGICSNNCKPNVAIIGAGVGGASSSHFLTELFRDNVNIDLYEAKTVGGRLATVKIDGDEFDAGGSVIHPQNKYMQHFVELLGLQRRLFDDRRTSIWNGDEIVLEESKWEAVSLAKLIYRYGTQPFSLNRYVTSVAAKFENIYRLQDAGESFVNITSFLSAMNPEFPMLLQKPIKTELLNLGYSERIIDEFVASTLIGDFGQDTNIQSFVGFVSLAVAAADLWAVKGGNKKVPERLIYRNKHVNIVPSYVTKIVNIPSTNLYEVHYRNEDSEIVSNATYDIVILATPLTRDQKFPITFEGFPQDDFYSFEKFHETVATFIKADLKPRYFGSQEELDVVLSCDLNKTTVNSVERLNSVEGTMENSKVWKIFSNAPLTSAIVNDMFSNVRETKQVIWKAHPEYSTRIREAKFKLHDALYHVNAVEWVASAMEMSAISGRNAALLAYKDFRARNSCFEETTPSANTPSVEL